MATVQDYLTFNLDNQNTLPFIDLKTTGINYSTPYIEKFNFLTPQNIIDIVVIQNHATSEYLLNPDPKNPDHIKIMCTIYRYVMIRLYCFFQLRAMTGNGAPITLSDHIRFIDSSGTSIIISRKDFFESINNHFILQMDLDRMGKSGEVISRRNTNPPGFYSTLLNNVKTSAYKPKTRHILGNVIKNFVIGNVVTGAMRPSTEYVFACTQRDDIDAHEDYIYNFINLLSNVTYDNGKPVYSFGMGYILSPGNTGCAVNVCAFIGIFTLAMILYILREHSSFFTSNNGTNESMLLNTHSLLNICNMISTGTNFHTTNNMYLYKFTLNTSSETQRAVIIGGSGLIDATGTPIAPISGSAGTILFQPYSPVGNTHLQLEEIILQPVIDEIKQLARQTVEAQIQLWSGTIHYTSIIKVLGRFLPKYNPTQNGGIPEYKHLWGHCYGIYIHIIKLNSPIIDSLLLKYKLTQTNVTTAAAAGTPDPYINIVQGTDYFFLISIAEPYFSRGLISYEPTFTQPNKFKIPYLQLHKPYIDNFNTEILISNTGHNCSTLHLPIKLLDTLTLRTLLDLQYYSDCRCYTSIEFQFVLNKPNTKTETIAIVPYQFLLRVHETCGNHNSLVIDTTQATKEQFTEFSTKTFRKAAMGVRAMIRMKKIDKIHKNHIIPLPQFPASPDDLSQEVSASLPSIISEEKTLERIIHDLFRPRTFDGFDAVMSMIGSFSRYIPEQFKNALLFVNAASDVATYRLLPGELLSINDDFYNYDNVSGGSKQKNMKGGAYDGNGIYNETLVKQITRYLSDISEFSGKFNIIQYLLCNNKIEGGTREYLNTLLQHYNIELYYNKGGITQELQEQVIGKINTDLYNRLFVINQIISYKRINNSFINLTEDNNYETRLLTELYEKTPEQLIEILSNEIRTFNENEFKTQAIMRALKEQNQIITSGPSSQSIINGLIQLYSTLNAHPQIIELLLDQLSPENKEIIVKYNEALQQQNQIITSGPSSQSIINGLIQLYSTLNAHPQIIELLLDQLSPENKEIIVKYNEALQQQNQIITSGPSSQSIINGLIQLYSTLNTHPQIIELLLDQLSPENKEIIVKYNEALQYQNQFISSGDANGLTSLYSDVSLHPQIKQLLLEQLNPIIKEKIMNGNLRTINPQPGFYSPRGQQSRAQLNAASGWRGGSKLERTRRKHHNKRKTIKRKKNRKTYKKRLHKNRKRRTHKG
jgi:hypothetical protein